MAFPIIGKKDEKKKTPFWKQDKDDSKMNMSPDHEEKEMKMGKDEKEEDRSESKGTTLAEAQFFADDQTCSECDHYMAEDMKCHAGVPVDFNKTSPDMARCLKYFTPKGEVKMEEGQENNAAMVNQTSDEG